MTAMQVLGRLGVGMILLCGTAPLQASDARFELGLRVQALERVWLANDSIERRQAALPAVEKAVRSFFSLALAQSAAQLDVARLELQDKGLPTWADSLSARPSARVVAPGVEAIEWTIQRVYPHSEAVPKSARIEVTVTGGDTSRATSADLKLPLPIRFSIPGPEKEGDCVVRIRLYDGDQLKREWNDGLSVIERLDSRLERLERVGLIEPVGKAAPAWNQSVALTSRDVVAQLRVLAMGQTLEIAVPAHRWLRSVERWHALGAAPTTPAEETEPKKGEVAYLEPGDHRFIVASPSGQTAVRWWLPQERTAETPIVMAIHGAGGSENMFFETYGAGKIVELAKKRGWIVVAPRRSPFGGPRLAEVITSTLELLGASGQPVFAVGHSMGAAELAATATSEPQLFKAAACLGGGGRLRANPNAKNVPFLVGAGDRDFGKSGARRLHQNILESGGKSEWREYPNCEHLLVVADALPDVFQFFEKH